MQALRPALFIDKDGTLVENVPYNADPALLRFHPGAVPALAAFAREGYALVVVTNQPGLALGRFSATQFGRLRQALEARLRREAGVVLAGFEVCPHAPRADGTPACRCRKPSPAMLIDAADRLGLDLARSWMVGDTLDDVEAGRRAGCRTVLLDTDGETVWRRNPWRLPDALLRHWDEVLHVVLASRPRAVPARHTA